MVTGVVEGRLTGVIASNSGFGVVGEGIGEGGVVLGKRVGVVGEGVAVRKRVRLGEGVGEGGGSVGRRPFNIL